MKDKQYFVHYSRKMGGSSKLRLHLSMFMSEVSLKNILCDKSKFDYVIYSATIVKKGKSKA